MDFGDLPSALTLCVATGGLFLGAFAKGVTGVGLPLVAVSVASLVLPVPAAISLLALPILVSNFFQSRQGDGAVVSLRRFWPVLLMTVIGILLGVKTLVSIDEQRMSIILGSLLLSVITLQILPIQITIPARREKGIGAGIGLIAGLIGGLSSFYGPLLAIYLVTLRLPKSLFIPAIGTLYFCAGLTLYASLALYEFLTLPILAASLSALVPVYAGMKLGSSFRDRLNERRFRQAVLLMLGAIGASLIYRSLA